MIRASRGAKSRVSPNKGDSGTMGAMTDFVRVGGWTGRNEETARPGRGATQLELAFAPSADGDAIVRARGELDIATADQAFAYLRDVLDRDGPGSDAADSGAPRSLTVNLEGLTFCDAAGLGALARLARHARQTGRELKLAAARPPLLRIMRITGMDETFPELRTPGVHMIAWPRQAAASE